MFVLGFPRRGLALLGAEPGRLAFAAGEGACLFHGCAAAAPMHGRRSGRGRGYWCCHIGVALGGRGATRKEPVNVVVMTEESEQQTWWRGVEEGVPRCGPVGGGRGE